LNFVKYIKSHDNSQILKDGIDFGTNAFCNNLVKGHLHSSLQALKTSVFLISTIKRLLQRLPSCFLFRYVSPLQWRKLCGNCTLCHFSGVAFSDICTFSHDTGVWVIAFFFHQNESESFFLHLYKRLLLPVFCILIFIGLDSSQMNVKIGTVVL